MIHNTLVINQHVSFEKPMLNAVTHHENKLHRSPYEGNIFRMVLNEDVKDVAVVMHLY